MHGYSSDGNDRDAAPPVIALFAVATALMLDGALRSRHLTPPWWLDTPSVMGFYGLFHTVFDRLVWRLRAGPLSLSPTPVFRGTWVGTAKSTHANGHQTSVVLTVRQTWSRILVRLETESSQSRSTMAGVNTHECWITYEYSNEPKTVEARDSMHTHRGTATLWLRPGGTTLEGDYYTGRGRENLGRLELTRLCPEELGYHDAVARSRSTIP